MKFGVQELHHIRLARRTLERKLLVLPCFIQIPVFNTNSVDPNKVPRFRRLTWVYYVFQCLFYGTLGIKFDYFSEYFIIYSLIVYILRIFQNFELMLYHDAKI